MFKRLFVLTCACLVLGVAPALPPQPKVHPAGIPAGFVMVSPCIVGMGEHWADPKVGPTGLIYGTDHGKPVFSEIMVSKEQFAKGFNYYNLKALPGYTIDHVNVEYHPHGHEGMPIPHYDIHAYYISHAAQLKICPNGAPDPDMEKMN